MKHFQETPWCRHSLRAWTIRHNLVDNFADNMPLVNDEDIFGAMCTTLPCRFADEPWICSFLLSGLNASDFYTQMRAIQSLEYYKKLPGAPPGCCTLRVTATMGVGKQP